MDRALKQRLEARFADRLLRPVSQRCRKSLRQGIFGPCHIARLFRQKGNQLAIARPRNILRRDMGKLTTIHAYIAMTGRTSIVPYWAPGHFAAQLIAASRSFTSMM